MNMYPYNIYTILVLDSSNYMTMFLLEIYL